MFGLIIEPIWWQKYIAETFSIIYSNEYSMID